MTNHVLPLYTLLLMSGRKVYKIPCQNAGFFLAFRLMGPLTLQIFLALYFNPFSTDAKCMCAKFIFLLIILVVASDYH